MVLNIVADSLIRTNFNKPSISLSLSEILFYVVIGIAFMIDIVVVK